MINIPQSVKPKQKSIVSFLQMMVNRLAVASYRYGGGVPCWDAAQDYRKRIDDKLEMYDKTGNTEFLVDVANYCMLDFYNSLHPNAHFKTGEGGGNIGRRIKV